MKKLLFISIIAAGGCSHFGADRSSTRDEATKAPPAPGIVHSNPRVYNVDYSFEMFPDPNKIERSKDLKVWIPVPREWDSQKNVKIISIQPEPHARYVDPDYGNPMLFWDFGKEPEQPSYKLNIRFRLESYQVDVEVDPNRVGPYDKTNKEYALYTRSTDTNRITAKIKELAQEAIGEETNPYLQAKRIHEFVGRKVYYKLLDFERGRGIKCLLDYPAIDEKTGEEHYEGSCSQNTALFVALCRAIGIPARSVHAYIGWTPWIERSSVKAKYPFEAKLSPDGLAATQLYAGLGSHMWAEFFIPNYGWIPADCTSGTMGRRTNRGWIKLKGRDILLGPGAPPKDGEGYGANWVPLHDGRADTLFHGLLNIAKIHTSKATILHHSDPFPADGLAGYPKNLFPPEDTERNHRHWRQGALSWPSYFERSFVPDTLNVQQFYSDHPRAKEDSEAFICHMLRRQLGDEKFSRLVETYVDLRQESGQAVSTSLFQELAEDISGQSLDWFFNQWVDRIEIPRLKLERTAVRKDKAGWQIHGRLLQLGETVFRLPIELALDTKNGRETHRLWMGDKAMSFDFRTLSDPLRLTVDPEYEVLKIQKMAPRFWWLWDVYPKVIIIYGTLEETEANRTAAERLNSSFLGLSHEAIKPDTDVSDADLKTKCIFLIGRPETNRTTQAFKDSFPIKFDGAKFTWQGRTYDKPTQAVAQIAQNPRDAGNLVIMHAGMSSEATQEFPNSYLADAESTYVIFDGDKELRTGDWEDADSNLYWDFDTRSSDRSRPNQ